MQLRVWTYLGLLLLTATTQPYATAPSTAVEQAAASLEGQPQANLRRLAAWVTAGAITLTGLITFLGIKRAAIVDAAEYFVYIAGGGLTAALIEPHRTLSNTIFTTKHILTTPSEHGIEAWLYTVIWLVAVGGLSVAGMQYVASRTSRSLKNSPRVKAGLGMLREAGSKVVQQAAGVGSALADQVRHGLAPDEQGQTVSSQEAPASRRRMPLLLLLTSLLTATCAYPLVQHSSQSPRASRVPDVRRAQQDTV